MRSRALFASVFAIALARCSSSAQGFDVNPTDASPVDVANEMAVPHDSGPLDVVAETAPPDVVDVQPDVSVDGGYDVPRVDVPLTGMTFTYVIDQITVDTTDSPAVAHTGLDLDGLYSGATDSNGCFHSDFFSLYDNDQHCPTVATDGSGTCTATPNPGCAMSSTGCTGGVDNQMPTLANTIETVSSTDVRTLLADEVSSSQFAVIVRVESVDDLMNDPEVAVSVYRGFSTFSTGCTSVAPGREYQVARSSLTTGGTTLDDALYRVRGSIVNGRLETPVLPEDLFPLELPVMPGTSITIPMHGFALRADISASQLARGTAGGWALGDEVRSAIDAMYPMYATVIDGVVGGLVDIPIPMYPMMGVCESGSGSVRMFGAIGAGFGIHAVPATISATAPIADAPAAGTCSAM